MTDKPRGLTAQMERSIESALAPGRFVSYNANFDFVAQFSIPGWLYIDSIAKPYITLLPDGGLVASDPTQNKLFRLDASGTPVATFDAQGSPLVLPRGVALDSRGYLYVAENEPDQVRRLLLSEPGAPVRS